MFCRIIKLADNSQYQEEFELMQRFAPEMVARKIVTSLQQSAQMLRHLRWNAPLDSPTLCVGSFEDVPAEVLHKMGWNIVGIDPVVNMSLATYKQQNPATKFDVVFSTSVIEHDPDDVQFVRDTCDLLNPGGLALHTCDFKPDWKEGDPVPQTSCRFYTKERLMYLAEIAKEHGCTLTENPTWDESNDGNLDFMWDGIPYTFAAFSFRKGA